MSDMPKWFPGALAVARHVDALDRWPVWERLAHRVFVAPRCPCCIEYKKWSKPK